MNNLEDTVLNITKLSNIVSEIKKISVDILRKMEPVIKKLKDPADPIVKEGLGKYPQYSSKLQTEMSIVADKWIEDASKVKIEIDKFIKVSETDFSLNLDGCPFLSEVWGGDAYDRFGLDGLIALRDDLKTQFENTNRHNLYDTAAKNLSPNKD